MAQPERDEYGNLVEPTDVRIDLDELFADMECDLCGGPGLQFRTIPGDSVCVRCMKGNPIAAQVLTVRRLGFPVRLFR